MQVKVVRSPESYFTYRAKTNLRLTDINSTSFSQGKIMEHASAILHITQQSYMKQEAWANFCEVLLKLPINLRKYLAQNKKSQDDHSSKKIVFFPVNQ